MVVVAGRISLPRFHPKTLSLQIDCSTATPRILITSLFASLVTLMYSSHDYGHQLRELATFIGLRDRAQALHFMWAQSELNSDSYGPRSIQYEFNRLQQVMEREKPLSRDTEYSICTLCDKVASSHFTTLQRSLVRTCYKDTEGGRYVTVFRPKV